MRVLTVGECSVGIIKLKRGSGLGKLAKAAEEDSHIPVHQWLQGANALLGEVRRQGRPTDSVLIMAKSADQALVDAERPGDPVPFVTLASAASVDGVVEVRIRDVNLVWIDTNYRAWSGISSV